MTDDSETVLDDLIRSTQGDGVPSASADHTSWFDTVEDELSSDEAGFDVITRSEYIVWVKTSLNRLYGVKMAATGTKTAVYRENVRRFQGEHGLAKTGAVDSKTQNRLIKVNEEVRSYMSWVHKALECDSVFTDTPTSRPNAKGSYKSYGLRIGIKAFQNRRKGKLVVDGFVGAKTEALLKRCCRCQPPGHIPKRRPPPPPQEPVIHTDTIKVVAKSFIKRIGSKIGTYRFALNPLCSPGASAKIIALAKATDLAFSENPRHDRPDDEYRLFTEQQFRIRWRDNKILGITPTGISTDVGQECIPSTSACLQPPPIKLSQVKFNKTGPKSFQFSWMARGRPHNLAEPAFQFVCPRTSRYIWHDVSGRIDLVAPRTYVARVEIKGSKFPSHRLFIDGKIVQTRPQGPFSNLWVGSRRNRVLVR